MPDDFEPAERGLREHFALWHRRAGVIVMLTGICGLAALGTSLLQAKRYQASAQVLVPVEPAGQPGQANIQTHFDPNRVVQTEAAFAVGDQVQRLAVAKVGPDGAISARGAKDSDVITLTATASTPDRAAAVANAYADSYVELRKTPDGVKGVLVIEPATSPTSPSSPSTTRNIGLGLAFGLVIGLAAGYVVDHLDDAIRNEHDLTRIVGLLSLGSVASASSEHEPGIRVVEAGSKDFEFATISSLLSKMPGAKILLVPRGASGREVLKVAAVLRAGGTTLAAAALVNDDPPLSSSTAHP